MSNYEHKSEASLLFHFLCMSQQAVWFCVVTAPPLCSPPPCELNHAGGRSAYLNYYPPTNKDFTLPAGQPPALLVKVRSCTVRAVSLGQVLGIPVCPLRT